MENREENKERESGKRTDGLVHIYCGDGKGKTTASVGAAVRAAGSGKKVVIKRFLKNDHSGEVEVLKQIPGITVLPCTRQFGFFLENEFPGERRGKGILRGRTGKSLETAWGQDADMLILDEAVGACSLGFIKEERLLELIGCKPEKLEVILTGRILLKNCLQLQIMSRKWSCVPTLIPGEYPPEKELNISLQFYRQSDKV